MKDQEASTAMNLSTSQNKLNNQEERCYSNAGDFTEILRLLIYLSEPTHPTSRLLLTPIVV